MDLHDELLQHVARQRDLDIALKVGITPQAIINAGGLGVADVTFGDGWFEFGGETPAIIVPAYDGDHLVDLVAWDRRRPERFARLERRAWCLGRWFDWWEPSSPLACWRTPRRWLLEGATGVVIFDFEAAQFALAETPLIAEDEHHAAMLRKAMQPQPWQGRVLVREAAA